MPSLECKPLSSRSGGLASFPSEQECFALVTSRVQLSACGPALTKQLISSDVGWSGEAPLSMKLYTREGASLRFFCFVLFCFFLKKVSYLTDIPTNGLQNMG